MSTIQWIIDSIPRDDFLGVMATDINPHSFKTCLVCRLISPDAPYSWPNYVTPSRATAEQFGLPYKDVEDLYFAAADRTAEVEEAIADRLNRLVSA